MSDDVAHTAESDALAEALWSQTPHGDTGDLSDLPEALQAEFRKRATNIRRRLLAAGDDYPRPWRQGHKVPRNVYDANDEPIIMAPSDAVAELIVRSVNAAGTRVTPPGRGDSHG